MVLPWDLTLMGVLNQINLFNFVRPQLARLSLRYTRTLLLMIKYFLPPTPSKQNPKKKYKLSLEYDHSFFGHVCVYKRIVNLYFPKTKYLNYGNVIQANSKGQTKNKQYKAHGAAIKENCCWMITCSIINFVIIRSVYFQYCSKIITS